MAIRRVDALPSSEMRVVDEEECCSGEEESRLALRSAPRSSFVQQLSCLSQARPRVSV